MKEVSVDEIVTKVSGRAQESVETTRLLLRSIIEVIREELNSGNRVVLADVATLEPTPQAAPAAAPVGAPPQVAKVLLVVSQKDFFTNVIVQRLTGPKMAAEVVEGTRAALRYVERSKPDLIVLDATAQGAFDLVAEIKKDRSTSLIAVVMIFPEGADIAKVEGLRVYEDEVIVEPYDLDDMVKLAEREVARATEERNFFEHEIHYQFQTTESYIEMANDFLGYLIDQVGMSEESAAAVTVAFREAVDNAARHGNKNQEKKLIDVIYLLDKEKVTVTVEDEGDGFDTELFLSRGREGNAVAAARERNQAGRVGGLGIMLMLKCVDDLEYNYIGNLVKLTKYNR